MSTAQKRITPEIVVEAYRKTGLVPRRGATCCTIDDALHGCAFGAMYLATVKDPPLTHSGEPAIMPAYEWAEREYGDYGCAFRRGFDGSSLLEKSNKRGYADGRACAKAVFNTNQESTP